MEYPTPFTGPNGRALRIYPHLLERFDRYQRATTPDQCWHWLGDEGADGHARIRGTWDGLERMLNAHHLSYYLDTGTNVPAGSVLTNTCETKNCTNPAHMVLSPDPKAARPAPKATRGR